MEHHAKGDGEDSSRIFADYLMLERVLQDPATVSRAVFDQWTRVRMLGGTRKSFPSSASDPTAGDMLRQIGFAQSQMHLGAIELVIFQLPENWSCDNGVAWHFPAFLLILLNLLSEVAGSLRECGPASRSLFGAYIYFGYPLRNSPNPYAKQEGFAAGSPRSWARTPLPSSARSRKTPLETIAEE